MTTSPMSTGLADLPAFFLLFARLGSVFALLPLFGEEAVPGRVRLLAALGLTAGLWSFLGPQIPRVDDARLPGLLVAELLVGLGIGLLVRLLWSAVAIAGSVASAQVGLSSALVFDPGQGGQAPLLSRFVGVAAAVAVMAAGVHHLWIAAVIRSYQVFPVGGLPPAADFARLAVETAGQALALGAGLAAPLLVYGLLFNVALGLATRLAPSIQLFFIAQPAQLLGGLALFGATVGAVLATTAERMANATGAMFG